MDKLFFINLKKFSNILLILFFLLFFISCNNQNNSQNIVENFSNLSENLNIENSKIKVNKTSKIDNKILNNSFNNLSNKKNYSYNYSYKNYNTTSFEDKDFVNNKTDSNIQLKYNLSILHKNITATIFWVGESASNENDFISNFPSCFDEMWFEHYGGIDDIEIERLNKTFFPKNFVPKENPYYVALPISEYDNRGNLRDEILNISWFNETFYDNQTKDLKKSIFKNRWVEITNLKTGKKVYAQIEDCGPFVYDDFEYVFGEKLPRNKKNSNAGIDLSPAVSMYLNLTGMDRVNWRFVEKNKVPDGPWNIIETKSDFCFDGNCNYTQSKIDKKRLTKIYNLNKNISKIINQKNKSSWYIPKPKTTWQWQLNGKLNLDYDVDVYDIDLFDTPKDVIDKLKKRGVKVICYFSAGSFEEWREDAKDFPKEVLGKTLEGWEDERWLDIRKIDLIAPIMEKRLDLAKQKGCDGVEADNIDGYINPTGFDLTYNDQLKYNLWLAEQAHKRNLSIGLKNDLDQINDLVDYFDFAINEQCFQYDECEYLIPFIENKKAVFGVEYELEKNKFCDRANKLNFSFLKMDYDLDGKRESCFNEE